MQYTTEYYSAVAIGVVMPGYLETWRDSEIRLMNMEMAQRIPGPLMTLKNTL